MKKLKFFLAFLTSLGTKDTDVAEFIGVSRHTIDNWSKTDDTYIGYIDRICHSLGYTLTILLFSPRTGEMSFTADCQIRTLANALDISRDDMARSLAVSPFSVGYILRQNLGRMMVSRLQDIADANGYLLSYQITPLQQEAEEVRHEGNRFVAIVHLRPAVFRCRQIEGSAGSANR